MCDLLYSVGIHCFFVNFVFDYPIVSHCSKFEFVFQKCYELEVIYILFLSWLMVSLPAKNRHAKNVIIIYKIIMLMIIDTNRECIFDCFHLGL